MLEPKDWPGLPVSERPDLSAICAAFGDALHRAGVPVTPERSARFASAVVLADPRSTSGLYWLGRVTLTTSREQFETFDRVFRQIFRGLIDLSQTGGLEQREDDSGSTDAPGADSPPSVREPGMQGSAGKHGTSATPGAVSDDSDSGSAAALAAVSDVERLNDREFSTLTAEELALLQRLVEQLPLVPPLRRGRRTRRHRSAGTIDVRSTLRRSHRTGGDPVHLLRRRRTTKPRRIVLIADVSGSMEPYARIYLHLLRGAVRAINAEAFVFATHLTRLTGQLSSMHTEQAYAKAAAAANDWSGGTRIGVSLKSFIDRYGRRGMARGAVVVVVSDGWESDRPEFLSDAVTQLGRLAHHIIWVNPRKAAESFEPLTGGMAAVLPHVDTFLSGHSLRALNDVMAAIAAAGDRVDRGTRDRARITGAA